MFVFFYYKVKKKPQTRYDQGLCFKTIIGHNSLSSSIEDFKAEKLLTVLTLMFVSSFKSAISSETEELCSLELLLQAKTQKLAIKRRVFEVNFFILMCLKSQDGILVSVVGARALSSVSILISNFRHKSFGFFHITFRFTREHSKSQNCYSQNTKYFFHNNHVLRLELMVYAAKIL